MNRAASAVVLALALVLAVTVAGSARAQGYRARVDLRGQGAAFRGVQVDSIPAGQVVTDAQGSQFSPDGFAVRCNGGPYCYLFRPGAVQRGGPVTGTVDLAVWGVGLPGLSFRLNARADQTLGRLDAWPGTSASEPTLQLLEGYAEYATRPVTVQAGRVQTFTRLGSIGFDGGRVVAREHRLGLEASAYGGYGLARGIALPVTSPALNPLDEYQAREQELAAGGTVSWAGPWAEARGVYQRTVDGRSNYLSSERWGLDLVVRPPLRGLSVSGGGDYDMARQFWGSADVTATFARGPVAAWVGGRRYRPHFDLWTIWGVFSPVPYNAGHALIALTPRRGFTLSARGERYVFGAADAESPLVDEQRSGWRWSARAQADLPRGLEIDAGYRREFGPGAASSGFEAAGIWRPNEALALTVHGAALDRPLEFRYDNASVWELGAQAEVRTGGRWSWSVDASRYAETRDRPDAGAFDWNQFRVSTRFSVALGSGADRERLPPATPSHLSRLPDGRAGRGSGGQ